MYRSPERKRMWKYKRSRIETIHYSTDFHAFFAFIAFIAFLGASAAAFIAFFAMMLSVWRTG